MKGRLVVKDRYQGRAAAALVVDGRLEDVLIDPPEGADPLPGRIARADQSAHPPAAHPPPALPPGVPDNDP